MKVSYSSFQTSTSKIFVPYLNVKLINGFKDFQTRALVDSGAYIIMISGNVAEKMLGLDWKKGIKSKAYGIVGDSQDLYINQIDLEIVGLENSRRSISVGVVDKANFGILLGQIGFFDFFNVAFCFSKKYFYVNPA